MVTKGLIRCVLLMLLCVFTQQQLAAQFTTDYTPYKYSSSGYRMSPNAYIKKLNISYHTSEASMVKKFNRYLYDLHRSFGDASRKKQFIEDPGVKRYLKGVLDTILKRNHINEQFDIICTRYTVPNAYNMGDKRLYVNIGILAQLNNEAQLAFLLAHELSHQLLYHVQDNFIALERLAKDKKVKKEIRDIKKARYNKLDRSFQFMKSYEYDFAKYSRANETSADSMAMVLLRETGYDLREANTLMQLLDIVDKDTSKVDFKLYFEHEAKTLNPAWMMRKEHPLDFGHEEAMALNKDSVKTHPDVPFRIKALDSLLRQWQYSPEGRQVYLNSKAFFDTLRDASAFELIESYLSRKRYAGVAYHSMVLLQRFPDNTYLYKNLALSLQELNKAIQKHTIQDFIPIESDEDFPESYNQFLRIIDRTTSDEFETLVKNYYQRYYNRISSYPEIQSIYDAFSRK